MATGRIGTTPVLQVRWSKSPSAGTTSLSGLDDNSVSLVYSVGYEAVYRNGVLLSRGNDYTATDGTTITLTDATITGDIIEVFANQTIPLSDTFSQTVADGRFIKNTLTTTTGDIIYASAANTPARLGIGSTGNVLTVSGGVPAWAAPSGGSLQVATFKDVKAQGTQGGSFVSGAWRTRDLNTTVGNTITSASLSSNQISLPAGTYTVIASAEQSDVDNNQLRVYNVTDAATLVLGVNSPQLCLSIVQGSFTIAGTKTIELQHRCSVTRNTYGFGYICNWGDEVYAQITLIKES